METNEDQLKKTIEEATKALESRWVICPKCGEEFAKKCPACDMPPEKYKVKVYKNKDKTQEDIWPDEEPI